MNTVSCNQIANLIDLYAAGACARDEAKLVRAHLDCCAFCRESVERSRQMLGLLDLHFGQEEALERLATRLKADARGDRGSPRTLRFVHRFAAVAALVLITFGLGVWLSPVMPIPSAPLLQLALVTLEDGMKHAPAPVRGKPEPEHLSFALTAKKRLDLEEAVKKAKDTGDWPDPPRVDVGLVVKNPEPTPVELTIGGPAFRLILDLSGPGVVRQNLPPSAPLPFAKRTVTIPPGGSYTLRIDRLASQIADRVENLYPLGDGESRLRVRLDAIIEVQGKRQRIVLTAGPMLVRLQ